MQLAWKLGNLVEEKVMTGEMSSSLSSRHFRLERLTEGVYTAVHTDGGWMICNAGIVDLGDRTLVFDTGLTPEAASDLRDAAEVLTGRLPNYVVNSHCHNDHIRGNQVFVEAMTISTERTRELFATKGQAELDADRKDAREHLAEMEAFAKSENQEKRNVAALFLPYWQGILASVPEIKLRPPELTFKDWLTFHGTDRTAELIAVGGGHTESDCVLFLPQEGVIFCGDLLFVQGHPYLGDGDPETLLSILDRVNNLTANVFVPGHGPVGERADLNKMQLYVRRLMQQVREVVVRGGTVEEAVRQPVPQPFTDWRFAQPFYEGNLRFLYGLLTELNKTCSTF